MGNQKIEFECQFDPNSNTPIAQDREGGWHIKLFAPESEDPAIHRLAAYGKRKALKATVEIGEEEVKKDKKKEKKVVDRTERKRKPKKAFIG